MKIKQEYAIYQYKNETVSITKAAEVAGLSFFVFTELLNGNGIPLKTAESSMEETSQALEYLNKII